MTNILSYWLTCPAGASPCPIAFNGVFYAGSVNPLHKSPQCKQELRMALATVIKTVKTNLDGPSPNGKKRSLAELTDAIVEAAENEVPIWDVVTEPQFRCTFVQYHGGIQRLHDHAVTAKLWKISKDSAPKCIGFLDPLEQERQGGYMRRNQRYLISHQRISLSGKMDTADKPQYCMTMSRQRMHMGCPAG